MNKILIYARQGVGKTSFLADAATWIYKNHNKKSRVITSDGGGVEPLIPLKELGIVDFVDISNWTYPFQAFQYLSSGYWPVDTDTPNSPLKPGFRDWKQCPFCQKDTGAVGLAMVTACKACGKPLPNGVVPKVIREPINGMEEVYGHFFEGLSSWGDRIMSTQADKLAAGDPGASAGGSDSNKGGSSIRFADGVDMDNKPIWVAGNAQPHYGVAVDYLARYVRNSDQLPGHKIWTALERVGKDEQTGGKIIGPSVPGRAGVDKCISWFNSVLHLDTIPGKPDSQGVVNAERKIFLDNHYAPDTPGIPFSAKLSTTPHKDNPKVIPPSFGAFVNALDTARANAKKSILEQLGRTE